MGSQGSCVPIPIFILLVLLISRQISLAEGTYFQNYTYNTFNQSSFSVFQFLNNATVSQGALQVTPETNNPNFTFTHQAGRILLSRQFTLFDGSKIASFSTSFVFNLYPLYKISNLTGEGLAFIVVPDLNIPANSSGEFLGLTNSTTDGLPSNELLAVEFDTLKQDFDPDNNHIGVNVNSVRSKTYYSLSTTDYDLSGLTRYQTWIDYNATSQKLNVFFGLEGQQKPTNSVITYPFNTSQFLNRNSYFGFAASTGDNIELNCILKWNLTVEILPEVEVKSTAPVHIIIPIIAGALVVLGIAVCFFQKHRSRDQSEILGALKSLPGMPREFGYAELKKATNNFDDDKNKLGQGGFGTVYRGILVGELKMEVAVKKFSRETDKGRGDFLAELACINRLRHRNLVKLVGWCHHKGTLLIVYDYMPNGSLDRHLFNSPDKPALSWSRRTHIVVGVATALHYLHNEYDKLVVHRDLKASNIMLDSDFNAKLGDFGLARVFEDERTASYTEASPMGTFGYIAPECFHTGKPTRESDVFAFGAVVLEIVCGSRPRLDDGTWLVDRVWTLHREGRILDAVDERLLGEFDRDEATRLLLLALACSHSVATERPNTEAIIQIIRQNAPPPWVPPFRPPFIWPMTPPGGFSNGVSTDYTNDQISTSNVSFDSRWTSKDSYQTNNTLV